MALSEQGALAHLMECYYPTLSREQTKVRAVCLKHHNLEGGPSTGFILEDKNREIIGQHSWKTPHDFNYYVSRFVEDREWKYVGGERFIRLDKVKKMELVQMIEKLINTSHQRLLEDLDETVENVYYE